jgi:hypothetical protein
VRPVIADIRAACSILSAETSVSGLSRPSLHLRQRRVLAHRYINQIDLFKTNYHRLRLACRDSANANCGFVVGGKHGLNRSLDVFTTMPDGGDIHAINKVGQGSQVMPRFEHGSGG